MKMEKGLKIIDFERLENPYFIMESGNGTYYVVGMMKVKNNNCFFYSSKEESLLFCPNLELGIDIKEVNTRGLELHLESNDIPTAMNELRKFAQVCDADYYSFEGYGDSIMFGYFFIAKVRPRIFRKIINN